MKNEKKKINLPIDVNTKEFQFINEEEIHALRLTQEGNKWITRNKLYLINK